MNELEAGPEMDVLIHTEVMGHPQHNWPITRDPKYFYEQCPGGWIKVDPPRYSTDISAAWMVVEKLTKNGFMGFDICKESPPAPLEWEATFQDDNLHGGFADTASEAICLAALLAVEEK